MTSSEVERQRGMNRTGAIRGRSEEGQASVAAYRQTQADLAGNDIRKQLEAMQTRFSKIVEISEDAIVSIDDTGAINLFNRGAERMFGCRAAEMLGQPIEALMPERFHQLHRQHLASFSGATEKTRRMGERGEIMARRRNGEEFPAEASILRFDVDGRTEMTAVLRDVSIRAKADQALRMSEARLANAQRIARLGNWEWNIGTNDLYWSEEIYRIFGLSNGRFGATYAAFMDRVHPEDRALVQQAVDEALRRGRTYSIDHRVILPGGAERIVHEEGEVTFDADHRPLRMTGTVQDITERKRTEQILELAKEQAETANRAKSEFLANMSHELRTPLNAVIGFAEIMVNETMGPLGSARYRDYANDIRRSGEHLLGIINDILDVSRIEAGSVTIRDSDIDVGAAIQACMRMVADRAAAAKLELTIEVEEGLPPLLADERMVKQMLLNLLSNAVKFTLRGTVGVNAHRDGAGDLIIQVTDTGIGIAPEDISRALMPFGQVDTALNRRFEGAGLGLHLTKSMIGLHGGRMVLQSVPAAGTSVSLVFPAARLSGGDVAMRPTDDSKVQPVNAASNAASNATSNATSNAGA